MRVLAGWAGQHGWRKRPHSQLLVSLATAMMPMGCWGMSTRSIFMSLPTYLLARCTARRTQSVQKMCSPYTASPKGWTGSDFRITCGNRAFTVAGVAGASPLPLALAPWPRPLGPQSQNGKDPRGPSLLMRRLSLEGEYCTGSHG